MTGTTDTHTHKHNRNKRRFLIGIGVFTPRWIRRIPESSSLLHLNSVFNWGALFMTPKSVDWYGLKSLLTVLKRYHSRRIHHMREISTGARVVPLTGLNWCTYCRCLRNHLKCHFLQIEMNNWLLHILKESIKVSLIAVSVEQLIYLFLTRFCLLKIPPRTLQRHPCPLGSQNYLNKDGWGS